MWCLCSTSLTLRRLGDEMSCIPTSGKRGKSVLICNGNFPEKTGTSGSVSHGSFVTGCLRTWKALAIPLSVMMLQDFFETVKEDSSVTLAGVSASVASSTSSDAALLSSAGCWLAPAVLQLGSSSFSLEIRSIFVWPPLGLALFSWKFACTLCSLPLWQSYCCTAPCAVSRFHCPAAKFAFERFPAATARSPLQIFHCDGSMCSVKVPLSSRQICISEVLCRHCAVSSSNLPLWRSHFSIHSSPGLHFRGSLPPVRGFHFKSSIVTVPLSSRQVCISEVLCRHCGVSTSNLPLWPSHCCTAKTQNPKQVSLNPKAQLLQITSPANLLLDTRTRTNQEGWQSFSL